jgi:predicted nucleic acid-binding protein
VHDRAGREKAQKRGIFVVGTLGVLNSAAEKGLLDSREALYRLQQTSFRASEKLIPICYSLIPIEEKAYEKVGRWSGFRRLFFAVLKGE